MKSGKKLFLISSFIIAVACFSVEAGSAGWKAGASSALITPDEPMWTAGYGGRKEPAREKISDIFIKALAIQDPQGEKVVIVTADFIGWSYEFPHEVTKIVSQKWGLQRKSIYFNASHSHCAPAIEAIADIPEEYSAKIVRYNKWLQGRCVEVIDNAM